MASIVAPLKDQIISSMDVGIPVGIEAYVERLSDEIVIDEDDLDSLGESIRRAILDFLREDVGLDGDDDELFSAFDDMLNDSYDVTDSDIVQIRASMWGGGLIDLASRMADASAHNLWRKAVEKEAEEAAEEAILAKTRG